MFAVLFRQSRELIALHVHIADDGSRWGVTNTVTPNIGFEKAPPTTQLSPHCASLTSMSSLCFDATIPDSIWGSSGLPEAEEVMSAVDLDRGDVLPVENRRDGGFRDPLTLSGG